MLKVAPPTWNSAQFKGNFGRVIFKIPAAVFIKSCVFWHATSYGPLKVTLTLRRNMMPPSSGLGKQSKKPA
jgi:hypothetical protein